MEDKQLIFSAYGIFRKWNTLTLGPLFHYCTNFHYRKDEPVKWSEVAGSGDTTVIATQYEAYATVNELGHEYEVPEHTAQQQPGSEDEISVTKCPAYVPTSEQEGGRVEEAVYEAV